MSNRGYEADRDMNRQLTGSVQRAKELQESLGRPPSDQEIEDNEQLYTLSHNKNEGGCVAEADTIALFVVLAGSMIWQVFSNMI